MPAEKADVVAAAKRIGNAIHQTPLATCRHLDEEAGCQVLLKLENMQKTGSFKARGAFNAVRQLHEGTKGLLTFSSGNHAQALSCAGRSAGLPVTVVMPDDAPRVKRAAAEAYGAEIVSYVRNEEVREEIGRKLADERGLTVIPPYDHDHIIAGQGTCALECREAGADAFVVPVGGGGLWAGSCLALSGSETEVWGVEPEGADDAFRTWQAGSIQHAAVPRSIADGVLTPYIGDRNWEIVKRLAKGVVTVTEQEIKEAMLLLWTRAKVVAEPTGAVSLAAVLSGKIKADRVICVISGGNLDVAPLIDGLR